MSDGKKVEGIVLIPDPTRDYLNERQLIAYKNHREDYTTGFHPTTGEQLWFNY